MKPKLGQIEKALENLIEGVSLRILGSPNSEKELIKKLVKTLEEQIQIAHQGIPTAPHLFILSVPGDFVSDIHANQSFLDEIARSLNQQAAQAGIHFDGNLKITVFPDPRLSPGEFTVQAIWRTNELAKTSEIEVDSSPSPTPKPPKAFLIVEGTKIFTIEQDVVNIGRLIENHLVIDDPRVSRSHAQIRAVKGRHILFDLGSSGGTFVNGERVSQISLHPGDVVFLAGVPLVYGQDMITHLDETAEYKRPTTASDESTTTIRIEDLNPDMFK